MMQAVREYWGSRDRILIIHLIFEGGIEKEYLIIHLVFGRGRGAGG